MSSVEKGEQALKASSRLVHGGTRDRGRTVRAGEGSVALEGFVVGASEDQPMAGMAGCLQRRPHSTWRWWEVVGGGSQGPSCVHMSKGPEGTGSASWDCGKETDDQGMWVGQEVAEF